MNISQRIFFVTGAGSGLGKETAAHLIHQNAKVVIADVDEKAGRKSAVELGPNALFAHTDITDESSIKSSIAQALERFQTIDGIINCAGVLTAERIIKRDNSVCSLEQFRRCIEINLVGTFNIIRLCSKTLLDNPCNTDGERGIIVNTASIAAYEGQIGQTAYSASKSGIIGMTLPLARELGRFGIRVMTIAPGVFQTPLFDSVATDQRQHLERQIPFPRRLGRPSEFAFLVQHIIENPMLNGETIRLDGALRLNL